MKECVINIETLPPYNWDKFSATNLTHFIGGFWKEGCYIDGMEAAQELDQMMTLNQIEQVTKLNGHFSFVYETHDYIFAFVDRIRSYPLFYCLEVGGFFLSNSVQKLLGNTTYRVDEKALLEFKMSGYSLGNKTLLKDIKQLQAGEHIQYSKKSNTLECVQYFTYLPGKNYPKSPPTTKDLDRTLNEVFKRLVESLRGKTAIIPLSGGYDSRLILAMLVKYEFKEIITYSYGLEKISDVQRAKLIAKKLNIKWIYIPLSKNETKPIFNSEEFSRYRKFASGYCSVPHVADYFAILKLRDMCVLPANSVFINGQTGDFISGGHIPSFDSLEVYPSDLRNKIVAKHFALWKHLITSDNTDYLLGFILKKFNIPSDVAVSADLASGYFESFEFGERQSKYVVNGQRIYEWFEYEWKLPLWDNEIIDFFQSLQLKDRKGQRLFIETLHNFDYMGIFNLQLPQKKQFRSPLIFILNLWLVLIAKIFGKDESLLIKKYSLYFMQYAPFYPTDYISYLKKSNNHRNAVSYWVDEYLKDIGIEDK